jgi:hypothetical protein
MAPSFVDFLYTVMLQKAISCIGSDLPIFAIQGNSSISRSKISHAHFLSLQWRRRPFGPNSLTPELHAKRSRWYHTMPSSIIHNQAKIIQKRKLIIFLSSATASQLIVENETNSWGIERVKKRVNHNTVEVAQKKKRCRKVRGLIMMTRS